MFKSLPNRFIFIRWDHIQIWKYINSENKLRWDFLYFDIGGLAFFLCLDISSFFFFLRLNLAVIKNRAYNNNNTTKWWEKARETLCVQCIISIQYFATLCPGAILYSKVPSLILRSAPATTVFIVVEVNCFSVVFVVSFTNHYSEYTAILVNYI